MQNTTGQNFIDFSWKKILHNNNLLKHNSINSKTEDSKYKVVYKYVVVIKRNDSRLNRHHRLKLKVWQTNCDIQIVVDYSAYLEYLVKYILKAERISSVVIIVFTNMVTNLTESSDVHTTFQQIMPRTLKQRDYSIQEVMYHLLSLKSISTSYEAVHVSLCVYHRDNIRGNQQPCTLRSTLDIYAE